MRATLYPLLLALAACASPAPTPAGHAGHGAPAEASATNKRSGAMGGMDEMCKHHAAERGAAAREPGMMARHCKAGADAAASAPR